MSINTILMNQERYEKLDSKILIQALEMLAFLNLKIIS